MGGHALSGQRFTEQRIGLDRSFCPVRPAGLERSKVRVSFWQHFSKSQTHAKHREKTSQGKTIGLSFSSEPVFCELTEIRWANFR